LYAGTETGLYVSFNGGLTWTQSQFGLPITPVTDLKVHQNDLIASTMGRAFWILDDIEVLREFDVNATSSFKLYTPVDVIRTSSGSSLNYPENVDEPFSPAPSFSGTNAASGAVIYYQLPENSKDSLVTLDILNSKKEIVRSYSSKSDGDFVSYAGGPDADPIMPARMGLNRFVWDLKGESITGVPTVFIEGDYAGYLAAPGEYTAILKVGGQVQTSKINLKPRPDLQATQAEYDEQQALMKKICEETSVIHKEVIKARKTAMQLRETSLMLKDTPGTEPLRKKADKIADDFKSWEEDIVQNKSQSNDDVINFVNKLTADYIFLKGELDSNTPYVPEGHKKQFDVLHNQWLALKGRKEKLEKEVVELNADISKANIGRIIL
jgi:hypothetical protein